MMSMFDPYHKWLGIPPEEQPPNHYRLLGVKLFEHDADVLENAADQRMAHVRSFQSGPRAADSQKILNELATARAVLLEPSKKAKYDGSLRSKIPKPPANPPAVPGGPPPVPAAAIPPTSLPAPPIAPAQESMFPTTELGSPLITAERISPMARYHRQRLAWRKRIVFTISASVLAAVLLYLTYPQWNFFRFDVGGAPAANSKEKPLPKTPLPTKAKDPAKKPVVSPPGRSLTGEGGSAVPSRLGGRAPVSGETQPPAAMRTTPLDGKLKVSYKCESTMLDVVHARMQLRIDNGASTAIPLSELTLRYWMRLEPTKKLNYFCDYAVIGASKITSTFHPLAKPIENGSGYLELGFVSDSTRLGPGESTGEIVCRIAAEDWTEFNQALHYSFDSKKTDWAESPRITLYRKGTLVWGTEPPGAASPANNEAAPKKTVSP